MRNFSKKFVVGSTDTAKAVGSGDLEVLATPRLIAMVENTAKEYLHPELAFEETSVGSFIETKHLKPSKIGAEVIVQVIVVSQQSSKIDFSFEVVENGHIVALGSHQRVVILTENFLSKLENAE